MTSAAKKRRRARPPRPRRQTEWWMLPAGVMRALGQFDLDPCAPPLVPPDLRASPRSITNGQGLEAKWEGVVWLNLPRRLPSQPWLCKLIEHGEGIAFLPAHTGSEEWHRLVLAYSSGVFLFRSRPLVYRECGAMQTSREDMALACFGSKALQRVLWAQKNGFLTGTLIGRTGIIT